MGIFNRKGKDEGWDEDAAIEFHNKAPASVSEVPARNMENPYETPTNSGNQVAVSDAPPPAESAVPPTDASQAPVSDTAINPPEAQAPVEAYGQPPVAKVVQPVVQAPVHMVSQAPVAEVCQPVVQPPIEAEAIASAATVDQAVDETDDSNGPTATGVPQNETPAQPLSGDSEKGIFDASSDDAQESHITEEDFAAYASRLVQDLSADVKKYTGEKNRLADELRTLKEKIDDIEANAPEFDSALREDVDALNAAITEASVVGVEAVEIPSYDAANELSGVIEAVQNRFAEMLPVLKKSGASASSMLETLVPESSMYEPTKTLLDFSVNIVEKIEAFLKRQVKLRGDLEDALESYDSLSEAYQKTRTELLLQVIH